MQFKTRRIRRGLTPSKVNEKSPVDFQARRAPVNGPDFEISN